MDWFCEILVEKYLARVIRRSYFGQNISFISDVWPDLRMFTYFVVTNRMLTLVCE